MMISSIYRACMAHKRRAGTARVAYARLMAVTGDDRCRCRDGRIIWNNVPHLKDGHPAFQP